MRPLHGEWQREKRGRCRSWSWSPATRARSRIQSRRSPRKGCRCRLICHRYWPLQPETSREPVARVCKPRERVLSSTCLVGLKDCPSYIVKCFDRPRLRAPLYRRPAGLDRQDLWLNFRPQPPCPGPVARPKFNKSLLWKLSNRICPARWGKMGPLAHEFSCGPLHPGSLQVTSVEIR